MGSLFIDKMDEKKSHIVVKDAVIIDFYKSNPNIDFIVMNHIFIDILKKLSSNLSETINNTVNAKLLSSITEMSKDFSQLRQDIAKINNDLIYKIHDTKKEYIEDVKLIISNNSLTNTEKINSILEKNNDSLLTKTNLIMNELIPKNQDKYYNQFEACILNLHKTINADTTRLLETMNKDDKCIHEFINNIDNHFNKMIQGVQQPIFSFIQSSEERTNTNISQFKDKLINQQIAQQTVQENLNNELSMFLNKYKYNSQVKGNVSEVELYKILQKVFPSDEILDCRSDTAACDFRVNRYDKNKPTILFENKDYTRSVSTDEVQKFERDLKTQKKHGIFISQFSSITYKKNFQIDIIDGLIHLYLPNSQYDEERIAVAVNIIDSLSQKLEYIQSSTEVKGENINVCEQDMEELLEEYNEFNKQKNSLIETVKTSHKAILDKLEDMELHTIKKILVKNNLILQNDNEYKCKNCNIFSGKNKASLAAHIRACSKTQKI